MPQLQKLAKGSSFRGGREVVALGSGRSAVIAAGNSVVFTFTIKEDTWINKLILTCDDDAAAPNDMSLTASCTSIIHNNTQMYSGDAVGLQMHAPNATNNPGLGLWVRTGDVLQCTLVNDKCATGVQFTASFTRI